MQQTTTRTIENWPDDVRGVAEAIIQKYGEPHEATPSMLVWYNNGPWLKTVVSREATEHVFPMPHTDSVEQTIYYDVPPEKYDDLARFDGSVTAKRTEGLLSARCHDEPANFLALNLAHDVITDRLTVEEAKSKYLQTLKDFRQKKPTPYLDGFQFTVPRQAGDPGRQMISKEELDSYKKYG